MRTTTPKASRGFTLTEIMIVVAIIGLLVSLVAPRALRARESACIETIRSNLRMIEDSKHLWATDQRAQAGALPPSDQLAVYLRGQQLPQAVAGETYNINPVGMLATATLGQSLVDLPSGSQLILE